MRVQSFADTGTAWFLHLFILLHLVCILSVLFILCNVVNIGVLVSHESILISLHVCVCPD